MCRVRFHVFQFIGLILIACPVAGQVRLPQIIRDSMILQRNQPVKIWGWASPKEKIKIRLNKSSASGVTDAYGKWMITLPAMKAGGPYEMDITASNRVVLKDILIGDVWLCSGQSNMVLPMERVKEKYPEEISSANNPNIRHFFIPTTTDLRIQRDNLATGYWKSAVPNAILGFSATAYFFAKQLYEKYKVPIGLINASVGGTPIEAWISEQGFANFPAIVQTINKNKDTAYIRTLTSNSSNNAQNLRSADKGLGKTPWYDSSYHPKGWSPINIPGYWEDQGIRNLDGVVWYRREINVPASMTGIPAKLFLGRIVDADFAYVNGKLAGNITYQYPPRRYDLPAGMLRPGKNVIVVRVINNGGKGGFVPDKPYYLLAGTEKLDLKGEWFYKVGDVFPPDRNMGQNFSFQHQPASLFNAMISPLANYTVKGILWYQGEANASNPEQYKSLLPALIKDWRTKWRNQDLPFLYVQLPNFMDVDYLPSESDWALLREAQLQTLSTPNTAMTVTIDIGEWNDIHPLNKKDVGQRLALAAEKIVYGENIVHSGPVYDSFAIEENKIVVTFKNTGGGLVSIDGEELQRFAIAGSDKKFRWAKAEIKGSTVVVWHDEIPNPIYVRYAWADNPFGANLYNKELLPASPFRTDK